MSVYQLLVTIISIFGNTILALIVIFNNHKSATNRLFSAFSIIVSIYLAANFMSLNTQVNESAFFWIKTVMSIAALINLLFFLMASTFPGDQVKINKLSFGILFVTTLFLVFASQFNLIFIYAGFENGIIKTAPGPLMPLFLLHTVLLLGGGFVSLVKKFKKSQGIEKGQIKLLFTGAILMFIAIIITNVVLVIVFNISTFVGLLPIYTLIFGGFVSYAIVSHNLFDIKVIATQAFVLIILVVLFSKIFVSQNISERLTDVLIFISMVVFGIFLIRSVVKEVKQREQLEELTEKLKALDKQKDEFISVAAHELRGPLTAIKGYLSMSLQGDGGKLPELATEFLTDGYNASDRMVRLISNLLNVGRIEEGRIVFQMDNLNLAKVVETVKKELEPDAKAKKIELTVEITPGTKDYVYVDPDRIHEVAGNLIGNAIKYTDKGKVEVRVNNPSEGRIRVEVEDTGGGIPPEEQSHLFQKFYRGESREKAIGGTGLGLYVSRLLIERFNGKIGVRSEVGKGSTFWFELPLEEAKAS